MIDFLTVHAPENPGAVSAVLDVLTEAFGPEEGALERRQLSGAELRDNDDRLFTAWENGRLLSTIHLTVLREHPEMGCLGGLITLPEARGKGLADKLFGQACEAFDRQGGRTLFLGTTNAMAARMYARHGFAFITGTNVMFRAPGSSLFDFYRTAYAPAPLRSVPMGDFCRVPLVPLAAARGRDVLMDANAALISTDYMTQLSCTGLYPRFLNIQAHGGVWCACLPTGAVAALCTRLETEDGANLDAFAYPGFESALPELLETAAAGGGAQTARIADCDREKRALFERLGFRAAGGWPYDFRGFLLPCTRFVREPRLDRGQK